MGKKPKEEVVGVDAATVNSWLNNDEVVLVDVRETSEYDQEHIPGAMLLPMSTFDPELFPTVPGKRVVLHCAVGKRSEAAGKMLLNEGYDGAIHMIGGIQEWKAAGYATEVQFVPHPGPQDIAPAESGGGAPAASSDQGAREIAQPISPHPGEVLIEEFLSPLGIEEKELAADIGVSEESINAIVKGEVAITAELSLRLARYF
ncbi:MAG: HigA family addiction module antidote protein, partial [Hyphomicrobiaceae bacterium]|nr:HigA family addiction module antidote protein [Hyphomicrobiaceae bacterium]